MKTNITHASTRTLLLLLLSIQPLHSQSFILNPSFESNYNDVFPHYGSIDDWTGGSGVNEQSGPFHNPPTEIPDRTRVAFSQGSTTLSQEIFGLTPGNQYWIQFLYDARNCCGGTIDIVTSFGGVELDRIANVRPAMLNDRPYYTRSIPFVPEADFGALEFTTIASGDATAVFDAVTIVERDTNNVVVINPGFEASGTIPFTGELPAMAGWAGAGVFGVDDSTAGFADNGVIPEQGLVAFIQGAGSLSQTIANLIVGNTYEVSLAYNAQSGTTPRIQVTAGDTVLFEEEVSPVGDANAYRTKSATFVASDISAVLTIAQTSDGADVLLLDDVRVTGATQVPLPPLQISPNVVELAPGQKQVVTITVPTELLEAKAATLVFRSPNPNVVRLLNADEEGVLTLDFEQGGANQKTFEIEAVNRGSIRVQIVDSAGLEVVNDLAASVITSFVRNPSFESSPAPGGVGYGDILAWTTPPSNVGLNKSAGPFHDNGAIPDREQVAFIQNTGTISQEISGLTPGQNYWLQFYYNVRNCCGGTMNLAVRFDGAELVAIPEIAPVLDLNDYYFQHLQFVATNSSGLLEFVATASGDASLLLDGITIVQRDPEEIVIRNPSFEASGTPANVGYIQPNRIAGWDAGGGGRGVNINGAGPFTDNGFSSDQDLVLLLQGNGTFVSQLLSGFEPGEEYTLIFDVNARACCGPEPTVFRASIDDVPIIEEEILPVGAGNPYLSRFVPFTAEGPELVLKLEHATPAGDHTALFDNVRIVKGAVVAQPLLSIRAEPGGFIRIAWPANASGFLLQSSATLPGDWADVAIEPVLEGNDNVVNESIGAGNSYYRLIQP